MWQWWFMFDTSIIIIIMISEGHINYLYPKNTSITDIRGTHQLLISEGHINYWYPRDKSITDIRGTHQLLISEGHINYWHPSDTSIAIWGTHQLLISDWHINYSFPKITLIIIIDIRGTHTHTRTHVSFISEPNHRKLIPKSRKKDRHLWCSIYDVMSQTIYPFIYVKPIIWIIYN